MDFLPFPGASRAPRNALLATAIALSLTACGGGGGGTVRSDPPPSQGGGGGSNPPPAQTCQDSRASNYGGPLPCVYRYASANDNILVPTNVDLARSAGFTGAGVKIGLLDDRQQSPYAPLDGQVAWSKDYTGAPADQRDPSPINGHGNFMGALLAGKAVGTLYDGTAFKGGVAPGASLYWGAVCFNNQCWSNSVAAAVSDMAAQGVRLFSASIDSYKGSPDANAADARIWAASVGQAVLNANGLIAFSTGNDSASESGSTALAPYYDARLKEHWLAVTAVDVDAQGNASGKGSYANACGNAKDWCLAAPGLTYVPGIPGSAFDRGAGQGTSGANAIVAGVAALVWQAFPWMSASNVQTTLLTTATDLGDPGVDAVYGWGLVNAAKAVKGPGQFLGAFDANVTGGSYTFANAIGGSGSLTKRGAGSLTLSGDNTYTGLTSITGGTLNLTGALAGSVSVGSGATFQTSAGRIGGSYTAQAGSTTAVQVGKGFSVTGAASLAGDLLLLPEAQGYSVKSQETILTAGTRTGTFANLRYGSGLWWTGTLSYTQTSVVANLTRASAAAQAMAAGTSLLAVAGAAQSDALVAYADARAAQGATWESDASLRAAARLMSAPSLESAAVSLESLTGRTQAVGQSLAVREALDDGRLLSDRAALPVDGTGAWVQASGQWGRLDGQGGVGADTTRSGLLLGADGEVRDGLTVGVALSAGKDKAALDAGAGRIDGHRAGLAAYAVQDMGGNAYVAGVVSADRVAQDAWRTVIAGEQADVARSSRTDRNVQVRVEGGMKGAGVNPFLAAGVLRATQGGFAESGSDLGLVAGAQSRTVSYGEAGLRWDGAAGAWTWSADLSGRWLLAGRDPSYRAAFVVAPGASFDVVGLPLDRFAARGGLTLVYRAANGVQWYLRGAADHAASSRNASLTAGVRMAW